MRKIVDLQNFKPTQLSECDGQCVRSQKLFFTAMCWFTITNDSFYHNFKLQKLIQTKKIFIDLFNIIFALLYVNFFAARR